MKNIARFLGIIGLIFFTFGALTSLFLQGELQHAGFIQFGLGCVGLIIFLFYYFGEAFTALARKKETFYGLLGGLLTLFILMGINVIAHSKWGEHRFDLTTHKIHSLSDESKAILKLLKNPVVILSFVEGAKEKAAVKDIVEKYAYESKHITFESYDPDKEPGLIEKYEVKGNDVVIVNQKTQKMVKPESLTEQDITTAIKRVISQETKVVYFLQGHGEGDLEDDKTRQGLYVAKLLLEREGTQVKSLNLVQLSEIPSDAHVIAAWGAKRSLSQREVNILENYLHRGGQFIVAQDPLLTATKDALTPSGYESLLEDYGLELGVSVMVTQRIALLQGQVLDIDIPVADYGQHVITQSLTQDMFSQFFLVQPVQQKAGYKGKALRTILVSTPKGSWAEKNIASLFIQKKPTPEGDAQGPLPIAQIAEWEIPNSVKNSLSKKGRLVVFGDADFGLNQQIQSGYNRDLFLNSFNYLSGDEASGLSIRPKSWTTSTLELGPDQKRLVYYASIFVIPQLILCLGLMMWLFRRSRT